MLRDRALQLLTHWCEWGWIRPLDRAFARFLGDLDSTSDAWVLLAGALVSHQLGRGHICLTLSDVVDQPDSLLALPQDVAAEPGHGDLPSQLFAGFSRQQWLAALRSSLLVAEGQGDTPLVLSADRLYLRRNWQYEVDVATGVMARVQKQCPIPDDLSESLASLFPSLIDSKQADWQKIACALAVRKAFSVITGGPGTGKTTTVVKLLALLQNGARQQGTLLRIRLAAPTGKAAARLTESISGSLAKLPAEMQAGIPTEASTLHKLLGARTGTRHLLHNSHNPIHADVVIVDEASMIDLEMMAALLNALHGDTRLLLLGDKDQLASVEAGSVLGDLCRRAGETGYDADTDEWLQRVTGQSLPKSEASQTRLDQQIAMLRVSHRFNDASGISQLAGKVNAGDAAGVQEIWSRAPDFADIKRIDLTDGDAQFERLVVDGWETSDAVGYRYYLQVLRDQRPTGHAGPQAFSDWAIAVLTAFDRFQVLCALRRGEWGVEALNSRIAELLRQDGLIGQNQGWYEGRPVLVTRNDYGLGLMNGDIGIALKLPDVTIGDSRLRVVFKLADKQIKQVLPSRLNDVESVYAMTVHKSQGSEFEHVALVMPDRPNPLLTRELVYTGITRARQRFTLMDSGDSVLRQAVAQRVKRAGGLAGLLG